ncbi:diguanylate cyclase [Aestuariibacter salexigens]|uniref:sensor domain-containing diguanylate cyclase n=1 Tax=Aestuariibacter salexigens TaxID=226010 RepID=UPI00042219D2|nr:diguanylate cyclase [Aestuariibacter salexigens]
MSTANRVADNDLSDMHWQHDLLGSIEVGIVVIDRDYKVSVWNQFMENHSNLLPSQVRGKSIFECFPEMDVEWFKIKAEPVFTLRTPAFLIWEQRPFLFRFGSNRPITSASDFMYQNVTLFPLASLTGTVEKICLLVYDVTDEAISKLNSERLNSQLQQISRTDGLTGLFNRRYWQEQFELEFKRIRRNAKPASVLMLDIDHFKAVNDTHGHPAGDQVIKRLAKLIGESVRETDVAGRYGGEEFTILLPDTTASCAKLVAERIRKTAQKCVVTHEGVDITFTISVGICEYTPNHKEPMAWLEHVDQALYKAKQDGRNQVVINQP